MALKSMAFTPRPFTFPSRTPSWFLGHMARSLRELPPLLEDIDLVIEARDARLPLTSINPTFDEILRKAWSRSRKGKERADGQKLVVYTKRDLAEERFEAPLKKALAKLQNQDVLFAQARSDSDARAVLRHIVQTAKTSEDEIKVLVVGMPNVGKSSLLNALRRVGVGKGKAFRVGAEAGITRRLTGTVKIHHEPNVYVYDTPGVMVPYLGGGHDGAERGLKLALTGEPSPSIENTGIKDGLFERDVLVDYLLWRLNTRHTDRQPVAPDRAVLETSYIEQLSLSSTLAEPTDDVHEFLRAIADRIGALQKGGEKDLEAAAAYLIRSFREGKLGPWTLDELEGEPHQSTLETLHEVTVEGGPSDNENQKGIDETVLDAVRSHLASTARQTADTKEGRGISLSQQKKADLKQRGEDRAAKMRARGFVSSKQGGWTAPRPGLRSGRRSRAPTRRR